MFTSDEGGFRRSLFTIEPNGLERTKIVDVGNDPAWSPDGTRIAYTVPGTLSHGPQLAIVSADGTGRVMPTDTADNEVEPSWSPDGTRIAFSRFIPADDFFTFSEIFVMNVDGTGQTRITDSRADGLGFNSAEPAWSPDGKRIAFTRAISQAGNQPLDWEIYAMNADGTGVVRLTHNPGESSGPNDLSPAWSPDGTQIVFSSRRDGRFGVHVMNADGTGLRRLADGPAGSFPAWSPDGARIVFADPFHDIFTIGVDGSDPTNLTGTRGVSELNPDWQPVNRPPDCSVVRATPASLGAPNHRFITVTISGGADVDGDAVGLTITGVTQDEPVAGPADAIATTLPDQVRLRAERVSRGDGRVYRIAFEASDGRGGTCTGFATASVRKGSSAVDSAPPSYDAFGS